MTRARPPAGPLSPDGAAQAASVAGRLVSGIVWLLAQNFAGRIIVIAGQLAIAALLTPSEFGQIGLTYTVMAVGLAISDFGIDSVLIQRQRTLRLWITAAFWLSLGLGVVGGLAMIVIAPFAAHLYRSPSLTGLTCVLAASLPLNILSTVPMTLLRAQLRYRLIATVAVAEGASVQALTVACAFAGLGAYSLVLPLPIIAAARAAYLWKKTRPRLKARLRPRRWLILVGDSVAVFGTKLVVAAVNQGDYVTLGLVGSQSAVGSYFFAFKLAVQPVNMLAGNLVNVLLPTLVQLRDDPRAQGEAAHRVARLLGIIIMPLAFCQAAAVRPVMHLAFGQKWDGAIPLVQLLSLALAVDAIAWVSGTLLMAGRRYRANLRYHLVIAPLFFLFVLIGGRHGSAVGVALGVCAYYGAVTPFYSWAAFRSFGVGSSRVATLYLVPAAAAAAAFGSGFGLAQTLGITGEVASGGVVIASGLMLYCAAFGVIDPALFDGLRRRASARWLPALGRQGWFATLRGRVS